MIFYAIGHKAQPQEPPTPAPASQPSSPQLAKSQPIDVVHTGSQGSCPSCASSVAGSPQPQLVVPPPPSAQEMARRQKETNKNMFWASAF